MLTNQRQLLIIFYMFQILFWMEIYEYLTITLYLRILPTQYLDSMV